MVPKRSYSMIVYNDGYKVLYRVWVVINAEVETNKITGIITEP
jgi:hypothetical protein